MVQNSSAKNFDARISMIYIGSYQGSDQFTSAHACYHEEKRYKTRFVIARTLGLKHFFLNNTKRWGSDVNWLQFEMMVKLKVFGLYLNDLRMEFLI